jgi:hypothetical protein
VVSVTDPYGRILGLLDRFHINTFVKFIIDFSRVVHIPMRRPVGVAPTANRSMNNSMTTRFL